MRILTSVIGMRKKKNQKQNEVLRRTDTRLAAEHPTANSAEFVPQSEPDFEDFDPENSLDYFDFIPEIKGNKF